MRVEQLPDSVVLVLHGMRDDDIPFLLAMLEEHPGARGYRLVRSELSPYGSTLLAMMFSQAVALADRASAARLRREAGRAGAEP